MIRECGAASYSLVTAFRERPQNRECVAPHDPQGLAVRARRHYFVDSRHSELIGELLAHRRDVAGDSRTMERVRFLRAGFVTPLPGGLGIDPAGIMTGARGASLWVRSMVRVTPASSRSHEARPGLSRGINLRGKYRGGAPRGERARSAFRRQRLGVWRATAPAARSRGNTRACGADLLEQCACRRPASLLIWRRNFVPFVARLGCHAPREHDSFALRRPRGAEEERSVRPASAPAAPPRARWRRRDVQAIARRRPRCCCRR
jgi:hypothetical protein